MTNPYFTNMLPNWGSQNVAGYGDSGEEGEWNHPSQGGNMNFGNMAQGAMAGLSAGAANSQPIDDFTVDEFAGFKGSGQGLMSGGVAGAIVGGVTGQIGQFSNINKNLKNVNTGVDGVTYDAYGRPVYQGSNITHAQNTLGELDSGINKLNKTHIDPATNLFSSAFGTRRKLKRKRAELQAGITQAQQGYNQAEQNFRNQSMQMSEYRDRLNNRNRMYNLYRFS